MESVLGWVKLVAEEKKAGARSGWKKRWGYEGGQMRLFMKLPQRGFNNARFRRALHIVNLTDVESAFNDGEQVTIETLAERGFIRGRTYGVKLLGNGMVTKKIQIEVDAASKGARDKLEHAHVELTVLS